MHYFKSHALLDTKSREKKANQILCALSALGLRHGKQVLDLGTGSGHIARALADFVDSEGSVTSVDVVDERVVRGFEFKLVAPDAIIPLESNSFDFVVSNHTVEHLSSPSHQEVHIAEIARVLRPGGIFYFAVPNRWYPVENHYKLLFLALLPPSMASKYMKIFRKGDFYDCLPLSTRLARKLTSRNGFEGRNGIPDVLRCRWNLDRMPILGTLVSKLLGGLLAPISPTIILICQKRI